LKVGGGGRGRLDTILDENEFRKGGREKMAFLPSYVRQRGRRKLKEKKERREGNSNFLLPNL